MKRLICLLLLVPLTTWAQDENESLRTGETKEIQHRVTLRGGSRLVGRLEPAQWRETVFGKTSKFGSLTIPDDEIRRIRFGRKADPDRFQQVRTLVDYLASADPDRRDFAHAKLAEMGGFAAPELQKQSREHEDPEVKRRAAEILKELEIPEEEWLPDDDQVRTARFSIVGTVGEETIKINVAELGTVTLARKDVIEIRAFAAGENHRLTLTGANTHISQWLKTGIQVKGRAALRVSADGQIVFPNWNNIPMNPEGSSNIGTLNVHPIGNVFYGTLLCRIGDSGPTFKIGRHFIGDIEGRGELQFALCAQIRNQPATGEYKLRVLVEEAGAFFDD